PKSPLKRVIGRRERRRSGVVLVDKVDRVAYARAEKTVGALASLVSQSLPEAEFRSLVHDAEQGLFQLAVILARRAEARAAAAELRRALVAAELSDDRDRQVMMIEKKIAEYSAVSLQMPQEIDALLRTVTVLVARRSAARISGPVATDVVDSIYLHSEKIQALSCGIEDAAATESNGSGATAAWHTRLPRIDAV
nr:hypothetical protein [Micromonospora sp. DSM 115978]